ncbi:hypothetical protein GCM10023149_43890 [Mucilaginibacter gynuensis]|uniref:Uncharacterized protein n=2 Tax=Mucilaginibacter gynuensis TaxID=1302236 RepID=A0ABP8H859_9SPHI
MDAKEAKQFFGQLDYIKDPARRGKPFLVDSVVYRDDLILEAAKMDELNNENDINYIKGQIASSRPVKWNVDLFDSLRIVKSSYIDSIRQLKKFKYNLIYIKLSKPYYSKNKQRCLIYINHYCGNLCAFSGVGLYKKIKGKWTFVRSYFGIVS